MDNVTVSSMMAAVDKTLDEEAARIDRVHGPHWETRADVMRNLVAVGAAIFAGTATLLDAMASLVCTVAWWSLVASWVLLVASISASLFVLWQSITLRSFYPRLFNSRPNLRRQFERLDLTQPDAVDRSAEILRTAVDAVVDPMGRAAARAQFDARVCLISFLASVLCFLAYPVLRLGSST